MKKTVFITLCLFVVCSCVSVPLYKKTYTVMPEKNKVCRVELTKKGIETKNTCFSLDAKDKDDNFMFNKFDGFIVISIKALRETLLKAVDGLK